MLREIKTPALLCSLSTHLFSVFQIDCLLFFRATYATFKCNALWIIGLMFQLICVNSKLSLQGRLLICNYKHMYVHTYVHKYLKQHVYQFLYKNEKKPTAATVQMLIRVSSSFGREKSDGMFDDLQMIYMSVRILRFWSLIYEHTWRRYVCLSMTTFLVFTQLYYMFHTSEGIDAIIRNSYMLVLWFNTLLRAYLLLYDREKYERLLSDLEKFYYDLKKTKDSYIQDLLTEVNSTGKYMARGNLFLGLLTCFGFAFYPLFTTERVLPFGSMIPGINEYKSPFYEFWYIYQMIITPMGCCMYIPYTSLIVALIMFSIVMCKALQFRLKTLHRVRHIDGLIHKNVKECIQYQLNIINYIGRVNDLTTYIFLLEFLAFGTLLCALLFLLIIVDSTAQTVIVCAYITMIFAQILSLYWYANELREQNLAIAAAAYDTEWFTFPIAVQKHILLMILRAQKPPAIMVGHIHPISLELFQSLLNASYTYFTLLKRVYT
ncbi:PREDICTED: odorant receptor 49b isoform X2 [Rhagoletis zephyria]|uniref:odorant receptor 49b isoform X2 n=1 Tax=Rhagoletis zephyria TaxID=28612 RepID=UPI00081180E2|nr:PREDICTED: odorant receptor 49b isoform X2 [Rhagoletis zephyria]